jgi:soluble lytic murein transglycosylase-like protein
MPKLSRLAVAFAAATSLAIAISAQPVYAARPTVHLSAAQAKAILIQAAHHHNLNPNFVLAVSYWESGWNQNAVSKTGAIGLMQVEPYTAAWAGPRLLHRAVNLKNAVDNAELGAALLRSYLTQLHDPKLTLAAYYQGLTAVRQHGIYRSSHTYVDGIWKLRNQFQAAHLGG